MMQKTTTWIQKSPKITVLLVYQKLLYHFIANLNQIWSKRCSYAIFPLIFTKPRAFCSAATAIKRHKQKYPALTHTTNQFKKRQSVRWRHHSWSCLVAVLWHPCFLLVWIWIDRFRWRWNRKEFHVCLSVGKACEFIVLDFGATHVKKHLILLCWFFSVYF